MNDPLPHRFYKRDVVLVAQELLGKVLIRTKGGKITSGVIVEVEAYLALKDPANHAYRGQTRRNASMFGPPGRAYVYAIHARYCVNAVTEPEGVPSAVLIRAVEPLQGVEIMKQRRGIADIAMLTRGPARLCEAFGIDKALDGWDLTSGEKLWIAVGSRATEPQIATACRIGVTAANDLPLRFCVADSPFLSRVVK